MKNKCKNDHRSLMEMLTKNIFYLCVCVCICVKERLIFIYQKSMKNPNIVY